MSDAMEVPQGAFALTRPDADGKAPLRAWDAADELVLTHLAPEPGDDPVAPATTSSPGSGGVVVVGDAWGALGCALAPLGPTLVVDSFAAGRAIEANLGANGLDPSSVRVVGPLDDLPERVDLVVVKAPKAQATLEHALHRLVPALHEQTVVVGAGMTRHVHTSTLQQFERFVGPTTTSRAVKKARLIHATPAGRSAGTPPWPRTASVHVDGVPLVITAHAGVFAGAKVDAGTALLLAHLPELDDHEHAVDLGCGTGIVGTVLGRRAPDLDVTFVDDSALAVASARATWTDAHGDRPATFTHGDGLVDPEPVEADLVVVNPPFHRDHSVGDQTAWQMFQQARDGLPSGGRLVVVGNRHLAHHAKLTRLFGKEHVSVLGSDPGYVVLQATV